MPKGRHPDKLHMGIKQLWSRRPKWMNKYFLIILLFVVYIAFFDSVSLVKRFRLWRQQRAVDSQIEYYDEQIEVTQQKISDLNENDSTLERYAREQYNMHAPDEDVFLIDEQE